jgi:hypothetical protein
MRSPSLTWRTSSGVIRDSRAWPRSSPETTAHRSAPRHRTWTDAARILTRRFPRGKRMTLGSRDVGTSQPTRNSGHAVALKCVYSRATVRTWAARVARSENEPRFQSPASRWRKPRSRRSSRPPSRRRKHLIQRLLDVDDSRGRLAPWGHVSHELPQTTTPGRRSRNCAGRPRRASASANWSPPRSSGHAGRGPIRTPSPPSTRFESNSTHWKRPYGPLVSGRHRSHEPQRASDRKKFAQHRASWA